MDGCCSQKALARPLTISLTRSRCYVTSLDLLSTLDAKFVANIHDEWQVEVKTEHAEEFGQLAVQAIKDSGDYYEMVCPLDAQYKIGEDWSETH